MFFVVSEKIHNGAISRPKGSAASCCTSKFQFHNGAISRIAEQLRAYVERKFQFHNGAISRSRRLFTTQTIDSKSFNSIMVRLVVKSGRIPRFFNPRFQFHNGAISRLEKQIIDVQIKQFQFHNGAISRVNH